MAPHDKGRADDAGLASLKRAASAWFAKLPGRYQDEFAGIAEVLDCPVEDLLLTYVAGDSSDACTSFVAVVDGLPWVGRNNDFIPAGEWNHVTVRDIPGRFGTALVGLPGDLFSGTGLNEAGLWLHYNWLPPLAGPGEAQAPAVLEPYVFLREALETCGTIREVEALLSRTRRTGGMYLFAASGRAGEWAVFECANDSHLRVPYRGEPIVRTNHYCHLRPAGEAGTAGGSVARKNRAERILGEALAADGRGAPDSTTPHDRTPPRDLVAVLADRGVEQREGDSVTVYSAIVEPSGRGFWFAGDRTPAASQATWDFVPFPWPA